VAFSFPFADGLGGSGGLRFAGSCFLRKASSDAMDSSTVGSLNRGVDLLWLEGLLLGFDIRIGSDTSLGEGSL